MDFNSVTQKVSPPIAPLLRFICKKALSIISMKLAHHFDIHYSFPNLFQNIFLLKLKFLTFLLN